MAADLCNSVLLDGPKLAIEFHCNRGTCEPLVPNFGPDVVRLKKSQYLRKTSPRHGNVLGEILTTCNHARLVICRKPHRLRLVKLGVLKCRLPEQTIQHGRRQTLLFHVKEIRTDDLHRFREWPLNRPLHPLS